MGNARCVFSSLIRWFPSVLAKLAIDRRGIAVVEFAFILPVMLLCYLGGMEISQAVAVNRMTSLSVSTVVNLVTQYSTISVSQTMPDILNASTAVLTPYPASNATVTVSCITIDAQGNATVAWSQSLRGSVRPVGQVIKLPAALDIPNTSVVLGEVTYAYMPMIDYIHLGPFNLSSSVYMVPRNSSTIALTS